MACRNCKCVTIGKVCPACKSSDLTPDWQGIVIVVNPLGSKIAKTLGITVKGKYALRVTQLDSSPKKKLLRFLSEDIQHGDITSALLSNQKIKAKIISREQGVVAGVVFARNIFRLKRSAVRIFTKDGSR